MRTYQLQSRLRPWKYSVLQNLVGATITSIAANKHQVLLLPTHNKQQPISFNSISGRDGLWTSLE